MPRQVGLTHSIDNNALNYASIIFQAQPNVTACSIGGWFDFPCAWLPKDGDLFGK